MTAARKSLLRPPTLSSGDTIGIIAPAGAVDRAEFAAGEARLRELGFKLVYSEAIFQRDMYFAGDARRRVDELHEMFRAPEVKAILCARGGYGTNHLLPHLDFELIASHSKIFCGYSDVTTLTALFFQRIGLIGFHGPMLAKDFAKANGVHIQSFLRAVSGTQPWSLDAADSPALQPLRPGTAEGRLYGGCLSLLVASLGTPYEIETDDAILFIEDVGEWPYRIDRMLMHLKCAGKLDGVRGIVFGEMKDCEPPAGADYTLQQVITRVLDDMNIPIAFGLRSGHVSAGNITLPVGVRARLTVSDAVQLDILESATTPQAVESKAGRN
ncbi:MAG TPA: LD-carboxypeptidase [Terriglobales bacterium]|nr:LD-carboxypeptidase [Terriglobales bacterium]